MPTTFTVRAPVRLYLYALRATGLVYSTVPRTLAPLVTFAWPTRTLH